MLAAAPAARAQTADAERRFDDGNRLMAAGQLAAACAAFEASNRIEPRAGTLIRLGECREANHQLASAWTAYRDALARVKDPEKKAFATARVADLEPRLSSVTLTVAPTAGLELTRDHHVIDPALWNHPIPLDGGTYVIAAHAPGHRAWTTTITVPIEAGKLAVTVPALASEAPPLVGSTSAPADVAAGTTAAAPPRRWTLRRELAVATGALAVAGGATGAVLGALAIHEQHEAEARCTPDVGCVAGARAHLLNRHARDRALAANVGFGLAGAAAVTALALWFTGAPERPHDLAVTPALAPGGAGLTLAGSW